MTCEAGVPVTCEAAASEICGDPSAAPEGARVFPTSFPHRFRSGLISCASARLGRRTPRSFARVRVGLGSWSFGWARLGNWSFAGVRLGLGSASCASARLGQRNHCPTPKYENPAARRVDRVKLVLLESGRTPQSGAGHCRPSSKSVRLLCALPAVTMKLTF